MRDSTTLVNNLQYTVYTGIGECWLATTTNAVCNSAAQAAAGATPMYRVIVDVNWKPKVGEKCAGGSCDYVVTTLRDPTVDPLFNSNGLIPTVP